jgi:transcriptional regulator of acetoin/glycerol metabolism
VLLCGASSSIDDVLSDLRPHLSRPIHSWPTGTESLPHLSTGTLLLEQVGRCSHEQQQSLLKWLADSSGRSVQIVSTTDQSLFDRVQRGLFLTELYYHLNTVYLDLSGAT